MTKTFKIELTVNIHDGKFTSAYLENVREITSEGNKEVNADEYFGVGVNSTDNKTVVSNRKREENET